MELLPEEKEEARLAEEEITRYKTRTVTVKEQSKPVRKPIPENIPRIEEHIYLENINPEECVELEPEITEVLEHKPEEFFVRRIIRHKYVLRDKSTQAESNIVTAVLPLLPLAKSYAGASLLADGYEVYKMYEDKKGVLPLGCWAHARRKFEEAIKEDKAGAEHALTQIGMLYDVERRADEENLSFEERADLRGRLSYPIMVAFEKWLVNEYPKVLPKGRLGKAIKYTYEIYHRLTRYHLDGRYRIDNNLAENSIRPLALGRKNYLFCGNDDAAENAAVIYSLMGCCKSGEVNFREWLMYALENIHTYDNDYSKDLAELLPHNWKANSSQKL